MPNSTCSVDGCDRSIKVVSRGWCNVHYQRWSRHGDPLGGTVDPTECARCGDAIPPKKTRGMGASYCGRECQLAVARDKEREKRRANPAPRVEPTERVCTQCGEPFTAFRRTTCPPCAKHLAEATNQRRCSADGCDKPHRAKGFCVYHYKANSPNAHNWKRYGDPETRRANLRRKTQRRRARLKGDANPEAIERADVGERDGWICGLCLDPVDRVLQYPDPMSPSLDHVLPLALGGRHTLENVQISHLHCNVAKGARVPLPA